MDQEDSQNQEDASSKAKHLPFTSLTLSLPTHFVSSPKIPTTLKIPTSLFNLSLSLSSTSRSRPRTTFFLQSTLSANLLSINPRRPSDPANAAALRRSSVVWFRSDLRLHDNDAFNSANNQSLSVLPLYCFDPTDFGKSGFNKTGSHRASFLIQSVSDLRKNLQARGSDLIVRIGKPETILAELVKEIGAEAVYAHREVSSDEVKGEEKIENALKDEGVEIKYFWGSTLYHIEDLPYKLEDMPTDYGGFREKLKGLKVRKTIEAPDQLKGLPSGCDVEPGEIPSLVDLGLNPTAQVKPVSNAPLVGGETEALNRLKQFAAECQAQPPKQTKDGTNDTIYGANFSCKISPWLSTGCLSPRSVFDELKKSAASDGDGGMSWLMYELQWRDFFRFITRKYSWSRQHNIAPVTACTGATA